ncbi:MAG TPA: hypothetical protein VKY15_06765 [Acidimicrobiales bacterium]|nr:hypothetical protein [Acidimicrobiales bacterium]
MAWDAALGEVVIFGGDNMGVQDLGDTWTYNGTTWAQQSPANSPPARTVAAMDYDPAVGGLVLFGGFGSGGSQDLGDTWTYAISSQGYWLVGADGGIFAFGDAGFHGSMGGKPLSNPVVGIAPSRDGGGFWLVATDGGIFAFGDAAFEGSMGGKPLNSEVVGMASPSR